MKDNLNRITKVRFNDFSQYDYDYKSDGRHYGYWTDYNKLHNGLWEVSYGTTADFDYCPVCGCFGNHYEGEDCCNMSGYGCGEYDNVTEKELLRFINEFNETEDTYIEYTPSFQ